MNLPARSKGALTARAERSYVVRAFLLPVQQIIHTAQTSGIVLLVAAVLALAWANSPWGHTYTTFWHTPITLAIGPAGINEDLRHLVNDGLMAVFFYVVGLEIKRELLQGELSQPRVAALPAAGALGGMLVPAALYLAFNVGGGQLDGWGVPMATDIAFALGVVALLGKRVPGELRVFLLALSIVDDVGAILVIAIFYTDQLAWWAAAAAVGVASFILVLNRVGARNQVVYLACAMLLWLSVFESGVHATIAGVALAVLTPSSPYFSRETYANTTGDLLDRVRAAWRRGNEDEGDDALGQIQELTHGTEAPLDRLERQLHPWASFVVLPLFALANAGVVISGTAVADLVASSAALGIIVGLVIGKPLGIVLATWAAVRSGLASLPHGASWSQVAGVGTVAGIGFTVSLFIAGLAFDRGAALDSAKIAILLASTVAGALGYGVLRITSHSARA